MKKTKPDKSGIKAQLRPEKTTKVSQIKEVLLIISGPPGPDNYRGNQGPSVMSR